MKNKLKSLLVGMFACLFGAAALYGQEGNPSRAATEGALPSLAAIKACNSLPNSAECLDKLFRDALQQHTTLDANSSRSVHELTLVYRRI